MLRTYIPPNMMLSPLKLFITHPLRVLNSKDDILHPVGNGLLASPSATGNTVSGDAVNCSAYCLIPSSVVSTAIFTTLTVKSAKPSLENQYLGTATRKGEYYIITES